MADLENRYLVLKLSHVEQLEAHAIRQLLAWCEANNHKMPELQCVVIEKDWMQYALVRDLVLQGTDTPACDAPTLAGYLTLLAGIAADPVKLQLLQCAAGLVKTPEQLAEEAMEDPEEQLNCAEAVLESFAAELPGIPTEYDCIGDFITSVVEGLKQKHLDEVKRLQVTIEWLKAKVAELQR